MGVKSKKENIVWGIGQIGKPRVGVQNKRESKFWGIGYIWKRKRAEV